MAYQRNRGNREKRIGEESPLDIRRTCFFIYAYQQNLQETFSIKLLDCLNLAPIGVARSRADSGSTSSKLP